MQSFRTQCPAPRSVVFQDSGYEIDAILVLVSLHEKRFWQFGRAEIGTRAKKMFSSHFPRGQKAINAQNSRKLNLRRLGGGVHYDECPLIIIKVPPRDPYRALRLAYLPKVTNSLSSSSHSVSPAHEQNGIQSFIDIPAHPRRRVLAGEKNAF